MIKGTWYKTDGTKEVVQIDKKTSLHQLQKMVGGLIEVIFLVKLSDQLKGDFTKGNDLILNEEGRLLDLPINPWSQLAALNTIWEAEEFRGDIVLIDGRLP